MSQTFVVSDIHGDFAALWSLLAQEGLVDEDENRTELGAQTTIVSVGDLLNAVLDDIHGDEQCAHIAPRWFDKLIVGNHEWPYLYNSATFYGFYAHTPLRAQYNAWKRDGFVVPAVLVGETLVTHAGWAFKSYERALDTYEAIMQAWRAYPDGAHEIFDAIGYARGGLSETGGILWSDWNHEKKHKGFSQVVGHTPNPSGPIIHTRTDGTYTLCIDTGCKGGGSPSGVWLNADGTIEKIVSLGAWQSGEGSILTERVT